MKGTSISGVEAAPVRLGVRSVMETGRFFVGDSLDPPKHFVVSIFPRSQMIYGWRGKPECSLLILFRSLREDHMHFLATLEVKCHGFDSMDKVYAVC
jgi:hypothetical protein